MSYSLFYCNIRNMFNMNKINLATIAALLLITTTASATPAQILLIRHAEKPEIGNGLSEDGFKRAQALRHYFETNPAVTKFGTPVAIYAMAPKDEDGSIRAIQTVAPLARDLNLEIHQDFTKKKIKDLAKEILSNPDYDGKMVLICWEHKIIPDIAERLGVDPRPQDWPGSDFSTVFEINYSNNQVSSFKTFSELL